MNVKNRSLFDKDLNWRNYECSPQEYSTFCPGYGAYLLEKFRRKDGFLSSILTYCLALVASHSALKDRRNQQSCEMFPFILSLSVFGLEVPEDFHDVLEREHKSFKELTALKRLPAVPLDPSKLTFRCDDFFGENRDPESRYVRVPEMFKSFIKYCEDKFKFSFEYVNSFKERNESWNELGGPLLWMILHHFAAMLKISIENADDRNAKSKRVIFRFNKSFVLLLRNLDLFISCGFCKAHYKENLFSGKLFPVERQEIIDDADTFSRTLIEFHQHVTVNSIMISGKETCYSVNVKEFKEMYEIQIMHLLQDSLDTKVHF